jgi:hypothetical protein
MFANPIINSHAVGHAHILEFNNFEQVDIKYLAEKYSIERQYNKFQHLA